MTHSFLHAGGFNHNLQTRLGHLKYAVINTGYDGCNIALSLPTLHLCTCNPFIWSEPDAVVNLTTLFVSAQDFSEVFMATFGIIDLHRMADIDHSTKASMFILLLLCVCVYVCVTESYMLDRDIKAKEETET